ncbi:ubiquitin carboxyl-terminal hydrolase 36-like isoform X2 [Littorina saxatilis]|uniref:ubiquitin carboxyl-terminal hydrolase 36-like isoform X2 n=1 Tax=Littorina saxatilis TaxID=31220 RepID=UPI0038B5DEAC
MPSVAEIDTIETSLKASLGRGKELDQNVASSAQRLLSQNIEFIPAGKPHALQLSSLKSKYILLQGSKKEEGKQKGSHTSALSQSGHAAGAMNRPGPSGDAGMGDSLPSPRVVLYPPERIKLDWRQMHKIGGGLVNLGNTCFMNSILQCLTYTAPFVNYCFSEEHPNTCKMQNFCLMCELRRHIRTAFHSGGTAFKPHTILHKLKFIAKHFRYGKQEDAHEFLRYLVDGLQRSCLNGAKLDKFSKETTVINQIFGGFLRSQVQCMKCSYRSNTYDPFMDLSLDIRGVYTVEDALAKYVKTETLDSDNAYKCEKCHQKVPAQKRFSVHKTPNVLTIQLNRFDYNRMAGKINRHIQFPEKLNMRPYMSQKQGEPVYYHLYGVVIHQGNHCSMGHYYCYVKAPSNVWYVMNDSMVHTVSASRVYQAEAYLLFYTKAVPNHHQASSKAGFIGPTMNGLVTPKFNGGVNKQAGSHLVTAKATNDVGVPVSRQMLSPVKVPQTSTATSTSAPTPTATTLPQKHKKISFGLGTPKPFQSVQNQMLQAKQKQDSVGSSAAATATTSPRIVMQIKNGKVTTIEKSPDGKSKVVKGTTSRQSTLVPYDDDSDSGGEGTSKDVEKKPSDKSPRVALNFNKDQGKENYVSEKLSSKLSQGAFNMFSASSPSAKGSPKKERTENPASTASTGNTDSIGPHWDLTLKLNRDNSAGLKKMTIDTQSPTRINSTSTSWFVQTKDSVPSPSLGSCSSNNSNHSVNSTTEWMVEADGKSNGGSVDKKHKMLFAGWKVTPTRLKEKTGLLMRSESLEDSLHKPVKSFKRSSSVEPKPLKKFKRSSSVEPLLSHSEPVLSNGNGHHSLDGFSERTGVKGNGHSLVGAKGDFSDHLRLNSNAVPTCKDSLPSVKEAVRLDFAHCSKDVPDETPQQNGHHHSYSDKQPLLASDDSPSAERAHKKHKKKKHKKDKDSECTKVKYTELQDSMTSEDGQPRRKHKKKKHKRDRDHSDTDRKEKKHKERHSSDSDHRRKRHSDQPDSEDESRSSRKRRKSESSDSEYMWEERTKETLLQEKVGKVDPSSDKPVPMQSWDHYVTDSLGKNGKSEKDVSQTSRLLWDGSKKSQVAEELLKRPTVTTWGGEKSQADIEAEKEERRRNRKTWGDHYEAEIDSGKVKKAKRKAEESPWSFNPFQKQQNHKNQDRRRDDEFYQRSQNSNSVPSLGRSHSDQTSYRHNGNGHNYRDNHNRNNSNGSHRPDFHHSHSQQSYSRRY